VADLQKAVAAGVKLEPGMSIAYAGQFEFMERANARLKAVVPATLAIIFVLLYLTFRRIDEALLIMATLPFALTGGVWFLYAMGYNLSIATGVGFIALAGVAAEFGVIMLLYLKNAWTAQQAAGQAGEAGLLDRRRPAADHDRQRHRQRGDEPHRRPDDRRHGERAAAVAVRRPSGLLADAPPRRARGRRRQATRQPAHMKLL
jgi:hypothetical protein